MNIINEAPQNPPLRADDFTALFKQMEDYARQLKEGLITKSEWLNAMINALIEQQTKLHTNAHQYLGAWMSAAMDDPNTRKTMKQDITQWMEVFYFYNPLITGSDR